MNVARPLLCPHRVDTTPRLEWRNAGNERIAYYTQTECLRCTEDAGLIVLFPRVAETKPSRAKFDRNAYQREYMRDARAAKKLGITVAEYRVRRSKGEFK